MARGNTPSYRRDCSAHPPRRSGSTPPQAQAEPGRAWPAFSMLTSRPSTGGAQPCRRCGIGLEAEPKLRSHQEHVDRRDLIADGMTEKGCRYTGEKMKQQKPRPKQSRFPPVQEIDRPGPVRTRMPSRLLFGCRPHKCEAPLLIEPARIRRSTHHSQKNRPLNHRVFLTRKHLAVRLARFRNRATTAAKLPVAILG
jgi:hypothetical protein